MPRQKDNGVTPELRAIATADPAKDLQKALRKRNLCFFGVAGYTIMVPGVPGGRWSSLVQICGIHTIEGTSDAIQSNEQERLQGVATRYAERYNHLLFTHLLRVNDPVVVRSRRQIDQVLAHLERIDPIRDAQKAIRESSAPYFIGIADGDAVVFTKETVPGIDPAVGKALLESERIGYPMWTFALVPEIMTAPQRQRYARQIARYIVPYNLCISAYYREQKRKR